MYRGVVSINIELARQKPNISNSRTSKGMFQASLSKYGYRWLFENANN